MKYTEKHWTTLKRSSKFDFLLESAFLIANSQHHKKSYRGDQPWDVNDGSWSSIYGQSKNLYCDPRTIRDEELVNFYSNYKNDYFDVTGNVNLQNSIDVKSKQWLKNFVALDDFECFPQTSTQNTIMEFCLQNQKRNIILHKEEYWQTQWFDSLSITTTKTNDILNNLTSNSAVILDLPLRGTMEMPNWINDLFNKCDKLQVPVLVDCAYLMLQDDPTIDFNRKCISHVCWSLSKTLSFNGMSLGFKFKKKNAISKYDRNYSQSRFAVQIMLDLMTQFSCRFVYNKYKPLQSKWCKILDLTPTSSVKHAVIEDDLVWFNCAKFWYDNGLNQNLFDFTVLYENDNLLTTYWNL